MRDAIVLDFSKLVKRMHQHYCMGGDHRWPCTIRLCPQGYVAPCAIHVGVS